MLGAIGITGKRHLFRFVLHSVLIGGPMKFRMLDTLLALLAAVTLAGSAWAVNTASVTATVSGSTLSVSGSASTSGLPSGTYNASLIVTNSSGQTVISGSNAFTIGSSGTMTLTTVDGKTYTSGMSVTTTSPQFCGTYSAPSNVVTGYIAVMSGNTPTRFQQMAPPDSTGRFCANLVLDPGLNTVWAAFVPASGQLIYATNQLSVNNTATNVAAGSVRIQLTWDKANDMDLWLYVPATAGGTATTSSSTYISYQNKTPSWGQLDIDSRPATNGGYGPENITVNSFPTKPGKYLIAVTAYDVGSAASTNCTLTVYTGGGTTLVNTSFALTRENQTYLLGYLNVTASGT
jgi:hypothetical protein